MNNTLQTEAQKIISGWGARRKLSIAKLKDLGYVFGTRYLALDASGDVDGVVVFKIWKLVGEHGGREAPFCYLQKDNEQDSGEIIDKPFRWFEKL